MNQINSCDMRTNWVNFEVNGDWGRKMDPIQQYQAKTAVVEGRSQTETNHMI
ncbi:Hypothetical protein FKW44_024355 [Caligus rogercresseyi]|uniref:Uncharacterized protein n=1 Tax=Caligus rogercresseyi TaxID=217165 RepID=A0A7T8GMT5_CALRO|nr:Hypothetical protein FKW44_024790 [Caligus rogercresseyi]QQP33103.1 Hypothetical protein FKW44_024355 [Caligus rogercresseyi]